MLDAVLKSKIAAGLEVVLSADGTMHFNVCVLEKKKSILTTVTVKTEQDVEEVKTTIPAGVPVNLVLNGKGIIHKKVFIAAADDEKILLQKVLPGVQPEDFYIQRVDALNDHAFISIIRKNQLDELLATLLDAGLIIQNCSLGPFDVNSVLPLIDHTEDYKELNIAGHQFVIQQSVIDNYSYAEPETDLRNLFVLLGSESVKNTAVIAFSAAFSYLIHKHEDALRFLVPALNHARDENKQKRIFQLAGKSMLAFFLLILLVNYFLFNHYWSESNRLATQFELIQESFFKYDKLQKEYQDKHLFFEKAGFLQSSRMSYYADNLAMALPPDIELTKMEFNPRVKKANEDSLFVFTPNIIHVSGSCVRSVVLNEWMNMLKSKPWISNISMVNYSQDREESKGKFSIEIGVK